jgi:hypothetical protein
MAIGADSAQLTGTEHEKACHLLGINVGEFGRAVLKPQVLAGREWVTQSRTRAQALNELGALCKTLYERMFGGLVERVNRALERPGPKATFIGVLDIAGFEIVSLHLPTTSLSLILLRGCSSKSTVSSSFASTTRTRSYSSSSIITCSYSSKKSTRAKVSNGII